MDLVVEFLRHNSMMNRRLLDACRLFFTEQLAASTRGTYGGIGATLVHIANSQEGYAARLLGAERPEPLPEDPLPGFDALAERFAHGDAQLEEAAARADEDRRVMVTGDDPPGTWWMQVGDMSSMATARSPWLRTSSTRRPARNFRSSGDMPPSLRPGPAGRQDERSPNTPRFAR